MINTSTPWAFIWRQHLANVPRYRFFYADERDAAGSAAGMKPNGDSHAEMFLKLAKGCDDLPYYVTFVDGKHVEFAL